jgi:hypothetical protein
MSMDLSNFRRSRIAADEIGNSEESLPRRAKDPEPAAPTPQVYSDKPKGNFPKTGVLVTLLFIVIFCLIGANVAKDNQIQTAEQAPSASETSQQDTQTNIDSSKYQAVFLTNGQTYFGKVVSVNKQYLTLSQIYYLNDNSGNQTNQKSTSSTSLIKLGCEIHAPEDKMTINMTQVNFWENLRNDGDVVKGINTFAKTHPNNSCS